MFSNGELGAIDILNVGDQFPGYTFNYGWSNGETTEDVSGLEAGEYWVLINSANCTVNTALGTWEICEFSVDFDISPINNDCDAANLEINVSPSADYSFLWNDPGQSQTQSIQAIYGNQYCVTISSGNPPDVCEAVACIDVAPVPLEIELLQLNHATAGASNGLIQVTSNAGGNATYTWSNGVSGAANAGLAPGEYTVTVTNDCGHSAEVTYMIQCELLAGTVQGQVTNVDCATNTGGEIELIIDLVSIMKEFSK